MDCPKCKSFMEEKTLSTLQGGVTIDRCTGCQGLWFDIGEAETLKDKWMSDHVDSGDPEVGKQHNQIRDIDCPRCGKRMDQLSDPYRHTSNMKPAPNTACTSMLENSLTTNMRP